MMVRTLLCLAILGAFSEVSGGIVRGRFCGHRGRAFVEDRVFVEARFLLIPTALNAPAYPDPTPGGVARANYAQPQANQPTAYDNQQNNILQQLTTQVTALTTAVQQLTAGNVAAEDDPTPSTPLAIPNVLITHCKKCHTGDSPEGDVTLAQILANPDHRAVASALVKRGIMPPESELPDNIRAELRNAIKGIK